MRVLDWFRRPLPEEDWEPGAEELYWAQEVAAYNEEQLYGETFDVRRHRRRRLVAGIAILWGIFLLYGALTTPRIQGRPVILTIPVRADRAYLASFDQSFSTSTTTGAANLSMVRNVLAGHEPSYAIGADVTQELTNTEKLLQRVQPDTPPKSYVVLQTELVHLLSAQEALLQVELTEVSTPGGSLNSKTVATDWTAYENDWASLNDQLPAANAQVALTWHAPAL